MGVRIQGERKSDSYVQVTLRLPPGLYRYVEGLSKRWGTTIQDTLLLIIWAWATGVEEDG